MKENISAAFSAYEPVHYKTFQGALDAFFEQECPQIGGSRTRQTLVNFIYNMVEAISKLLKIVKVPSLRSDKGSVFPPSHKATAGQAPVTLQVASANCPLQLFANGIFAIF